MSPFIVLVPSKANDISIQLVDAFCLTSYQVWQVGQDGMQRGARKSYTAISRKHQIHLSFQHSTFFELIASLTLHP